MSVGGFVSIKGRVYRSWWRGWRPAGRCRHSAASLDTRALVSCHIRVTNIYFEDRMSSYPLNNSYTSTFRVFAFSLFHHRLSRAAFKSFLSKFPRLSFSLSTRWKPQQNFVRDAPGDWSVREKAEEYRSVLLRLDDIVVERGSARFDIGVFPSNLSNHQRVVVQWCNREPWCPMQFVQQILKCISRAHRRYQISFMKFLFETYRTVYNNIV